MLLFTALGEENIPVTQEVKEEENAPVTVEMNEEITSADAEKTARLQDGMVEETSMAPAASQPTVERSPQADEKLRSKRGRFIPLIAAILAVVIAAGVLTAVLTTRPSSGKKLNLIYDIKAECEGRVTELTDMKAAYAGYRRPDGTFYYHEGVVLHGSYLPVMGETEYLYADPYDVMRGGQAVSHVPNDGSASFEYDGTMAVALSMVRGELDPGKYSITLHLHSWDEKEIEGTVTLSFRVKTVGADDTVSFNINESTYLDPSSYQGETIEFYNGRVGFNDYDGSYLSLNTEAYYGDLPVVSDCDVSEYVDRYISGKAKIVAADREDNWGADAALVITEVYDLPQVYMPYCGYMMLEEAKEMLTGLSLEFKEEVTHDEMYEDCDGMVVEQDVLSGTMVDFGTVVTLTVYRDADSDMSGVAELSVENNCEQLLSVKKDGDSSKATAVLYEKNDGIWSKTAEYDAYIGRNGIGEAKEGTGVTPEGLFRLGYVLSAEEPDTGLRVYEATQDTCIVDDVNSALYNNVTEVSEVPRGTHYDPIGKGLIAGGLNSAMIIIEFNGTGFSRDDVTRGGGSAIGLRGRKGELSATNGDVDISAEDMESLLSALDVSRDPMIEITSGASVTDVLEEREDAASDDVDTAEDDAAIGVVSQGAVAIDGEEELTLSAVQVTDGTLLERLYAIACYDQDMLYAYDIKFMDGTEETTPDHDVTVSIVCGSKDARVFYVNEPKDYAIDMGAEYQNGRLAFQTSKPGYYVVAVIDL